MKRSSSELLARPVWLFSSGPVGAPLHPEHDAVDVSKEMALTGHDITGLWAALAERFQQMGGNSAPAFLRMVGKDTFMPTDHVVRALEHWGAIEPGMTGRALTRRMNAVFAAWHETTGKPLAVLSQTLAHSVD